MLFKHHIRSFSSGSVLVFGHVDQSRFFVLGHTFFEQWESEVGFRCDEQGGSAKKPPTH